LAILAILTPLGILATGSAWGEWSVEEFVQAPAGMQSLAHLWSAPFAKYAPPFLQNTAVGYAVSALLGMIAIAVVCLLWRRRGFIERTLKSLLRAAEYAAEAEHSAESGGVLQRVDPRVKVVGLMVLIVVVAASHRLAAIGGMFVLAVVLALLSGIGLGKLAGWVWTPVLLFTGAIALPAIVLVPQGVLSAAFLIARAETAATLSALLVLTTPWPLVLKALRVLKCPIVVVAILGMTYRYIFEILRTALDMFESRRSRTVGELGPIESRRLAASAVGVLLSKSFQLSGDVHLAMQSRGFRGEVYVLPDFRARAADWCWLAGFVVLAAGALWWGR